MGHAGTGCCAGMGHARMRCVRTGHASVNRARIRLASMGHAEVGCYGGCARGPGLAGAKKICT